MSKKAVTKGDLDWSLNECVKLFEFESALAYDHPEDPRYVKTSLEILRECRQHAQTKHQQREMEQSLQLYEAMLAERKRMDQLADQMRRAGADIDDFVGEPEHDDLAEVIKEETRRGRRAH